MQPFPNPPHSHPPDKSIEAMAKYQEAVSTLPAVIKAREVMTPKTN